MAVKTQQPKIEVPNQGGGSSEGGHYLGNNIWVFAISGAPTDGVAGDGATWAGPGSLCLSTNGNAYRNSGTKASPTWTAT